MKITLKRNVLAIALLALYSTTSAAMPVCSSPDSDPDGDGWGWENNASCTTSLSPAPTASAGSSSTGSSSNGGTLCSSAALDPDGDGWGWENNRSCMFATASAASTASESDSVREVTTSGPPQCTSAAADPDGDGWGWENNRSCLADVANNTQPDTTTEAPQTAAIVETPGSIRIMALGDSITHGTSNQSAASYRRPFTGLMTSNDCQFEMVGSQTGNHFHNTFVSPHEGYNGHTADQILNGLVDNAGNNEGISVTANRYQPHVVMLHIGSNDMRLGQNIEQTVAEIDQVISVILATDSAPVVMLANVIPWYANATVGANVDILGDRIEAYVEQLNDPRVQLVDVRGGFQRSMMLDDGAHPNPTGEQHIADRFFEAYDSAGLCR